MSLQATSGDNIIFSEQFVSIQSVNANGGVVTGTPDFNRKGVFEAGEYIDYPNKQIDFKDAFTITGKVKLTSDSGGGGVVKDDTGSSENYNFVLYQSGSSTNLRFYVVTASGTEDTGAVDFGLNEEHRFTCVYDKSLASKRIKLYKDDQLGSEVDGYAEDCLAGFTGLSIASYAEQFAGEIKDVQCFDKALTAEEVKDLYEQDTIPELDRPLIDLLLRSSYWKANGVEVVADGDMEAAGVADWEAYNSTLTKETTNPHSGTRCLRVAGNGTGNPAARAAGLTIGKKYKITGWARSDGTVVPRLYQSPNYIWLGTSSTDWQYFEVTFIATETNVRMFAYNAGVGEYVEWDDVSIELMENLTENKGTLGGTAKMGDGSTTTTMPTLLSPHGASFDGGDYVDLGTPPTLEGALYGLFRHNYDGSNDIFLGSAETVNTDNCYIGCSNVLFGGIGGDNLGVITGSRIINGGIHSGILTWDGSNVYLYLDGELEYSAAQDGNVNVTTNLVAGAVNIDGSNSNYYIGDLFDVGTYDKLLTPRQAKIRHKEMMKNLNV